jgi:sterol desaturase/sphingolipid hydroxylase (fatty acid hydroxylase superfamily)
MSEPLLRLVCFGGVLAILMTGEALAPRRPLTVSKRVRWLNNLGLGVLDTVLLRLLFPLAAVGMAEIAQTHGWGLFNWGLFNQGIVPEGWAIAGSMVALDLIIYLQHRAFHAIPLCWRFHRVHHVDLDLDVSSGVRFHPVEIVLSMGIKVLAVVVLGAPPVSVVAFEILLNATALFNHSNLNIPLPLDRILRQFIVTPDMHRVHHSVIAEETNCNFSFNLPWWDRWLGTYCAQPAAGHDAMTLGVGDLRDESLEQLPQMLALPFRS